MNPVIPRGRCGPETAVLPRDPISRLSMTDFETLDPAPDSDQEAKRAALSYVSEAFADDRRRVGGRGLAVVEVEERVSDMKLPKHWLARAGSRAVRLTTPSKSSFAA